MQRELAAEAQRECRGNLAAEAQSKQRIGRDQKELVPRIPSSVRLGSDSRADLVPSDSVVPFGVAEATLASRLYKQLPRARGREVDIARQLASAPASQLHASNQLRVAGYG